MMEEKSPEDYFQILLAKVADFYNELETLARKAHLGDHSVSVEVRGILYQGKRPVVLKVRR